MALHCTLHLVDEEAIRTRFVPRLLGRPSSPSVFDRLVRDADRRFHRARLALTDRHPETAGQYVRELAILYASADMPFNVTRNVALSFWHECKPAGAPDMPADLTSSPDPLFADLIAAHPDLAGRLSGDTFVAASRVPIVLAWVGDVLAQIDRGERRAYAEIVRTLEVARERGCAYWEGVDLRVARRPEPFPDRPAPAIRASAATVRKHRLVGPTGYMLAWSGPTNAHLVIGEREANRTWCYDANHWPPREMGSLAAYCPGPVLSSSGDWLLMKKPAGAKHIVAGLIRGRFDDRAWQPLPIEGPPLADLRHAGFLARRAAIICHGSDGLPYRVLVQEGAKLIPGPVLPPHGPFGRPLGIANHPRSGFAVLSSGVPLIMWDGDFYRVDDHAVTKHLSPAAHSTHDSPDMIATPSGGLLFLANRRLFEVRADGTTVAHARDVENIMHITRGPEGTILLKQGDNPEADVAKIYDPAAGAWASLTRELFAFPDSCERFESVFWSRRTDLVIAQHLLTCHAVETRAVLALERTPSAARPRMHEGFEITIKAATGHHDRVAALSPCYWAEVEMRLEALLHRNARPLPSRPFIVSLTIAPDGAAADVAVLGYQPEEIAGKLADEIRKQPSPLFYPPATGEIQIEVMIEYVKRRRLKKPRLSVRT